MTVNYSLDSIIVRGHRLFGWGFCLESTGSLIRCAIEVPLADGGSAMFEVLPGGYRDDLVSAFPEIAHAGAAGFMLNGLAPAPIGRGVARIVAVTRDGRELSLPLADFPDAFTPATDLSMFGGVSRIREIARSRGWGAALASAAMGVARRLKSGVRPRVTGGKAAFRAPALVLDHAMGGGANRYRESRIEHLRAAGHDVILVVPDLATLSYRVIFRVDSPRSEGRFTSQVELQRALGVIPFVHLEINNLVGFEDPLALVDGLVAWRQQGRGHLRFQLHDFHAICPSFTLIASSGEHCSVPDLEVCRRCLPANVRHTLGLHTHVEPADWRSAWARMLECADEVVAFSEASMRLLLRGQPAVSLAKVRIEAHALDPVGLRAVTPRFDAPVCVAAVGQLNHAKGAGLLRRLASRSAERGLPLRFMVAGTLEGGGDDGAPVRVTGKFSRATMCDVLEAEGVGIALLPSICPETYSYVTDELMAMGLPLAVLDIGAPPERVIRYHSGLILPAEGLDAQLDALVAFAEARREASRSSPPAARTHG